jgi:drug/metabolite transporter (DMT)-like permease
MNASSHQVMGPVEWTMLIALSAIWGGSFYFFAVIIKELPVFTIVFLRVFLATLALWLIVLITRQQLPDFKSVWLNYFLMGFFNNVIPFSLIVWGESRVAPGLAAVLNATTPFFAVIIAHLSTENEKLTWNRMAGAIVGLAGVTALVGFDVIKNLGVDLLFQMAIVLASLSYGISTIFGRRFSGIPPLSSAALQTAASSIMLFPLMLFIDHPQNLAIPSLNASLSLLALALLCTAFAYLIFFNIVKRAGMTNVTLVTLLVPVSAMILGAMFLNEQISFRHGVGMATIGFGLALIDGRIPRRMMQMLRGSNVTN